MKKALFIGGTGTISMAITRRIARDPSWKLYLINRGRRMDEIPENVTVIQADINDEETVRQAIADLSFDTVCDFIAFVPAQLERDIRLFSGKTGQLMFISSASAYHKPVRDFRITEGTTLANPYWEYSRNKIACEELLLSHYRKDGLPVTIIRPSHTYDERSVPLGVHGNKGPWQVLKRILDNKPVLIPGDGTSLWTVTFNEDFARGFVGLMANPHAIGEAFHITSDESLTWNQIHETIASVLGRKLIPYHVASDFLDQAGPYDFRGSLTGDKSCSVVFDCTKLKRAVPGYQAEIRFEQGAEIALNHILAHPELQVPDPKFDASTDRVIEALEKAKKSLLH